MINWIGKKKEAEAKRTVEEKNSAVETVAAQLNLEDKINESEKKKRR